MTYSYIIYQAPLNVVYTFMDYDFAMSHNWSSGDYVPVYRGVITSENANRALDQIFTLLNINRPTDYHARSLSVSDLVLLDKTMYYCDSFGWKECPKERA